MNLQVVAGIIENEVGQILLAERPPGKHLAGLWEFPGGKIEASESPEAALQRELKEELELPVRVVESLGLFTHVYPKVAIDLHVFRVEALGPPKATTQVKNFRWVAAAEIIESDLAPADIKPLRAYLQVLAR